MTATTRPNYADEVDARHARGAVCNAGPTITTTKPDGKRWCFRCRARRLFLSTVSTPVAPSYYGPTATVRCIVCRTVDGDLFPGRYREWPDQ